MSECPPLVSDVYYETVNSRLDKVVCHKKLNSNLDFKASKSRLLISSSSKTYLALPFDEVARATTLLNLSHL